MRKNGWNKILKEAEEDSIDKNFDFPDEIKELPDDGENEKIPADEIRDPGFTFEVRGNFEYKELEKLINVNNQGLTSDKIFVTIKTIGSVTDSEYEEFINFVEEKMPLVRFEE